MYIGTDIDIDICMYSCMCVCMYMYKDVASQILTVVFFPFLANKRKIAVPEAPPRGA